MSDEAKNQRLLDVIDQLQQPEMGADKLIDENDPEIKAIMQDISLTEEQRNAKIKQVQARKNAGMGPKEPDAPVQLSNGGLSY